MSGTTRRNRFGALGVAAALLAVTLGSGTAFAACRVTDFTDKPLAALNEAQRLSFISQMTQTEFTRLHQAVPGAPNYHPVIASSQSLGEAQAVAKAKIEALALENTEELRRLWATDYLNDAQLRKFADCVSSRQPGLLTLGRRESADKFHLTFAHITPIGIEKITTRLIASYNVANAKELEDYLEGIGAQDNYVARTVPLRIADPAKRAVVVLRAGWETPRFVIVPAEPQPDYFK